MKTKTTPQNIDASRLMWGTYGKGGLEHCNGTCPLHPLRIVRLVDCNTEHLFAILRTQLQIPPVYYYAIIAILTERIGATFGRVPSLSGQRKALSNADESSRRLGDTQKEGENV